MIKNINEVTVDSQESGVVPPFWSDRVTLRVKKAEFKLGKQPPHRPRVDLTVEILAPLETKVGGINYTDLNKEDLTLMLMLDDNNFKYTSKFHKVLGLPDEIDNENPNTTCYEGLVFDYILGTREKQAKRKDENGEWVPITTSDGKPIKQGHEWNIGTINKISIDNVVGKNTENWDHMPLIG